MEPIIFDNLPTGNLYYDGAAKKFSVVFSGKNYMVKYPTKAEVQNDLNTDYSHSSFSEDISCRLINAMQIPGVLAQNTLLGESQGKIVVACEDFTSMEKQLVKFNMIQNTDVESDASGRHPYLSDILSTYHTLPVLTKHPEFLERFWDTFILDSWLGNFDRHSGNWGFLNDLRTGELQQAPVFDCGSCLYPALAEKNMMRVIASRDEIDNRIYNFPSSAIKDKETKKKLNYAEFLRDTTDTGCTEALRKFVDRYDASVVGKVIEETSYISEQRKTFYRVMLQERYEKIILPAVKREKYTVQAFCQDYGKRDQENEGPRRSNS